jgi:hypothetical protein
MICGLICISAFQYVDDILICLFNDVCFFVLLSQDDCTDDDSTDQDDDSSSEDIIDQDDDSSEEEEEDTRTNRVLALLQLRRQKLNNIGMLAHMFGTTLSVSWIRGEGDFKS